MKDILYSEKITEYGLPYIEIYNVEFFETKHIFECGQCFRWNHVPGTENMYIGVAGGFLVAVSTENTSDGKNIIIANATKAEFESFWKNYFDLSEDYGLICDALSKKDKYLEKAVEFGRGIRILRQEFFETLISFILSANNNIPRIKGCVEKICKKYGNIISPSKEFIRYLSEKSNGESDIQKENENLFYTFPTAQQLEKVKAQDYSDTCKAGYRCAYLESTVSSYLDNPTAYLSAAQNLIDLEAAEKILQAYNGVGPKVASCILLFSGLRKDVFPIDVWVRRVLEKLYFQREVGAKEARQFAKDYFGDRAGFAQQYLFYHMREKGDAYDID